MELLDCDSEASRIAAYFIERDEPMIAIECRVWLQPRRGHQKRQGVTKSLSISPVTLRRGISPVKPGRSIQVHRLVLTGWLRVTPLIILGYLSMRGGRYSIPESTINSRSASANLAGWD
jgi:hypothetical protein